MRPAFASATVSPMRMLMTEIVRLTLNSESDHYPIH